MIEAMAPRTLLGDLVERSADPRAARTALRRIDGVALERAEHDPEGAGAHLVRVVAASRSLTRLLEREPEAVDVLARLDDRAPPPAPGDPEGLVRWQGREFLRLAARDLSGLDDLAATTAGLADLAADVLRYAVVEAGAEGLAVVGMGKLGGRELNYGSDIDLLFVGGEVRHARAVMELARRCYRVDANLRPEGRDGPLTRSLDGYSAYWERWAEPWEFQALLKAVPVAGDPAVGRAWAERAAAALWGRSLDADDVRSLRAMKARSEAEVARRGRAERDVKLGRGGIRDIEFSVQLLQLVHGGVDPEVRSPTTLDRPRGPVRRRVRGRRRRRRAGHGLHVPAPDRARPAARGRPADPHAAERPRGPGAGGQGHRATGAGRPRARSRRSTTTWPTTATSCGPSTSGSTSARCSPRWRGPARSARRRPPRAWRRSGSATSTAPARRSAS